MTEYRLSEVAEALGAKLQGDPNVIIRGIAPIESAAAGQITFILSKQYSQYLASTKASAIIMPDAFKNAYSGNVLIMDNPKLGHLKLAELFEYKPRKEQGIHPTAIIGEHCTIDASVRIGAYAVIEDHVKIGANTIIAAGSFVGDYAEIGTDCYLWPKAVVHHHVILGNHVVLQTGAVIGGDGFSLVQDHTGKSHRIPQLGTVILGDFVEVGVNSTVDRGSMGNTVLEEGVKLDNHVQIAHNCTIGAHSVFAGSAGVAGSTKIGKYCMVGGATSISDHIEVTDQVIFTGRAMVTKSIKKKGLYSSGTGIQENHQWHKSVIRFRQLDELAKRIQRLERKSNK